MQQVLTPPPGDWRSAINAAKPGDIIRLGPGQYNYLNLYGPGYDRANPGVVITLDKDTVINGVAIQGCGGYSFTGPGLILAAATPKKEAVWLLNAHDISFFGGVRFAQSLNATPDQVRKLSKVGLRLDGSPNVFVTECDFGWLGVGVAHRSSDNLHVSKCTFHDISTDGIHGASSYVIIDSNTFTDFYAAMDPTGHRTHFDPVQFWTTNVTKPLTHILVRDNAILRGKGDTMSQLQMGDEADRGQGTKWTEIKVGYYNVEVCGNLFMGGGNFQIEGAVDAYVHDNCFAGTAADTHTMPDGTVAGFQPKPVLAHCIGGRIENNVGIADPVFYLPVSKGTVKGNQVFPSLRAPAGDFSPGLIWLAGRRSAR